MNKKVEEIYEKATDIFFGITKKFDGISEKIFEQTGTKINVGMIVGGAILIFFTFIVVKAVLGWVIDFLL